MTNLLMLHDFLLLLLQLLNIVYIYTYTRAYRRKCLCKPDIPEIPVKRVMIFKIKVLNKKKKKRHHNRIVDITYDLPVKNLK